MSKTTRKPKSKKRDILSLNYKIVSKNCPFFHSFKGLIEVCADCDGWNDEQLNDLFGISVTEVHEFYDKYTMRSWNDEVLIPIGIYQFILSAIEVNKYIAEHTANKEDIAVRVCTESTKSGRWFNTEPVLKYFYISRNANGTFTYKFKESQSIAMKSEVPELSAKYGIGSIHNQQVLVRNP